MASPQQPERSLALDRSDSLQAVCARLVAHLNDSRESILTEIRDYPTPIAGCDQQFNHLLEERDRVAHDLQLLQSLARNQAAHHDRCAKIRDLIESSDFLDRALKAELIAEIRE